MGACAEAGGRVGKADRSVHRRASGAAMVGAALRFSPGATARKQSEDACMRSLIV